MSFISFFKSIWISLYDILYPLGLTFLILTLYPYNHKFLTWVILKDRKNTKLNILYKNINPNFLTQVLENQRVIIKILKFVLNQLHILDSKYFYMKYFICKTQAFKFNKNY